MRLLATLAIIFVTSISAWILGLRMRLRIRRALRRNVSSELELTSLNTWLEVEDAEKKNAGDKLAYVDSAEPELFTGNNLSISGVPSGLSSLDDDPAASQLAARQEFLRKWYRLVALAPFAMLIFINLKFLPQSNNPILVGFVFISLLWAVGVAGYAFYLLFFLKCPNCARRFGGGDKCRSCGLPKHRDPNTLLSY